MPFIWFGLDKTKMMALETCAEVCRICWHGNNVTVTVTTGSINYFDHEKQNTKMLEGNSTMKQTNKKTNIHKRQQQIHKCNKSKLNYKYPIVYVLL